VNASKENPMNKRTVATLLAVALIAMMPAPAGAWVAAGGYHGGVAVGYHPPCCYHGGYSGAAVAGAAIGGAMIGAAVASSAKPAPVYVAAPVYYAAPVTYAPAVGTVVAGLPPGCSSMSINGVSYMNCAGVFYMPFYSGGALMYQVAQP
jgi:Family of unknown function (DUF6515)